MAVELTAVVAWCDEMTRKAVVRDFPGSYNGLQCANRGTVSRLGAAVDADARTLRAAADAGIDFLIVHHGLFWAPPIPLTGPAYDKVALLRDANLAVYGSHLPLDGHPEIGNNVLLARLLGLEPVERVFLHEGEPIGLVATGVDSRDQLRTRLERAFPGGVKAVEFGQQAPQRIAILTGSGSSVVDRLGEVDCDTLVTGELRQQYFTTAADRGYNLYVAGHHATEVFGVQALAAAAAAHFDLPWSFLDSGCPL